MQDLLQQLEETPDAHGGDSLPSPTGLKQLQFELNTKRDTFQVLKPTIVYSSPLRRALLTAVAAYPHHGKLIVDQRLREINTTSGLAKKQLQAFMKTEGQKSKSIDFSRLPSGPWWATADESAAQIEERVQSFLAEVNKHTSEGKVVAFVAHHGIMKQMSVRMKKYPPGTWGSSYGFPLNFKPYYAELVEKPTTRGNTLFRISPVTADRATVFMLRHVHSRAQTVHSLKKMLRKHQGDENKVKKIGKKVQRFLTG